MHKRFLTGLLALAVSAACLAAPSYDQLRKQADDSLRKKNYPQAIRQFEKLVYLFPGNSEAYNGLGYACFLDKRYDRAIFQFKEALNYNPNNASAQQNLILAVGELALEQTRDLEFSEAISLLQQTESVFQNNPQGIVLRYRIGQLQFYRGKPEDGLQAWREVARRLPDSGVARFVKAYELQQQHKGKEAVAAYQEAVKKLPDDPVVRNYAGEAMMETGKTDAALAQYARAVRSSPPYPAVHLNFAEALQKKGDLNKAITQVKAARSIRPDFASLHLILSSLYKAQGNNDAASRELGLALADDKRTALLVNSATPGMQVLVDNERVGVTPTGAFITPGSHRLKVGNATGTVDSKAGQVAIATGGDSIQIDQADAATLIPSELPAYNFALRDQSNKYWRTFQHFHKRPVVLLFWKAGGPGTAETLGALADLAGKYQEKIGCAVIHTDMDKKSQAISQMMSVPAVFARLFDDGQVMVRYKISEDQLPRVVVVDLEGYVAYQGQGMDGVAGAQQAVDRLLGR